MAEGGFGERIGNDCGWWGSVVLRILLGNWRVYSRSEMNEG